MKMHAVYMHAQLPELPEQVGSALISGLNV